MADLVDQWQTCSAYKTGSFKTRQRPEQTEQVMTHQDGTPSYTEKMPMQPDDFQLTKPSQTRQD